MDIKLFVSEIIGLQKDSIMTWKHEFINLNQTNFLSLVEQNHGFNYQLWHAEDRARREDKGYEFVYHAKRDIDQFNQQRNDRVELMDQFLFTLLKPSLDETCPVHSETPGMMIDRLSILALKIYHMGLQVSRPEVDELHRTACLEKTQVLTKQQQQLSLCLEQLLTQTHEKSRTFKVYHQFKMYNDKSLNPELYGVPV